jgi:nicotinamidase/pyrazinamidase
LDEAVKSFSEQFPQLKDPIPAAMQQVLWPVHCLQNTDGAAFHDELDSSYIDFVFRKGYHKTIDSYSAFFENDRCTPTDLYEYLKKQGIDILLIGGLALDYCVFYSVIDSLRLGFKTYVIIDACKGIDMPPGSIERASAAMKERGALFCSSKDFE